MDEKTVQTIQTILIVRNDGTSNWEKSDYCLLKGELGIGYLENGNVIVKSGVDGNTKWANCPQVEGVLEKDLILTYNFGRHTTSNGFVDAKGKGMTVSQWIEDALSVTEDPDITKPEASISASFTPSSGEAGTAITKVNWDGSFVDGTYEFGSTETKNETNATNKKKANASVSWVVKLGETQIGTSQDGSYAQSLVMGDSQTKVTLNATATLITDDVRTPLNNVGAEVPDLKISEFKGGGTTYTNNSINATVTGYRKMFFGYTTSSSLNSAAIRALKFKQTSNKTEYNGVQASTTEYGITLPAGATNLVIACPTNSQGKKYTLSLVKMFSAGVWDTYTAKFDPENPQEIDVADVRGGENGLQKYNVYQWKFAGLNGDTDFKITLKSANA